MEKKIRMHKDGKATKSSVVILANKLGYTLEINGRSAICLVKHDKRLFQKSYNQAYHYLYMKNYRVKNKKENK